MTTCGPYASPTYPLDGDGCIMSNGKWLIEDNGDEWWMMVDNSCDR